jgi:hypothetical protein
MVFPIIEVRKKELDSAGLTVDCPSFSRQCGVFRDNALRILRVRA